jgi:hypothetical protein
MNYHTGKWLKKQMVICKKGGAPGMVRRCFIDLHFISHPNQSADFFSP